MANRYDIADFYNTAKNDTPQWERMGKGFTALDENPSAQTDSKIYIHEKSQTTTVKNYQTTFPFTADYIESDEIIKDIYNIATRHATGADAEREYIRVELLNETSDGVCTARKFKVSVQVSGITGAGGEMMAMSGNLNALGDPEDGTFNIDTKTFTAKTASATL